MIVAKKNKLYNKILNSLSKMKIIYKLLNKIQKKQMYKLNN